MNGEWKTQTVPRDFETQRKIRDAAREWVRSEKWIPPQTLSRLQTLADRVLESLALAEMGFEHFTMILLHNALWETYFPRIAYEERLLLLPFCLRNQPECQAPYDELGLLCDGCGKCQIPDFSEMAEQKGMAVLVAESSSRVSRWVRDGEIEAIVGVSCLKSLEKAFPDMLRHAVPGIAIPLTVDGCQETFFETNFLQDALALEENRALPPHPSGSRVREKVRELFLPETLRKYLNLEGLGRKRFAEEVVHALGGHGKHYRPKITLGTYQALTGCDVFPEFLNRVALAVECFHKASLIHDDIEDDDDFRYEEPTFHRRLGIPVALNLGDFLLGEGYRLLGDSSIPADIRGELYTQAAEAHRELALGQARELETSGEVISWEECLETLRLKTAPAFRVALAFGAISAGKWESYRDLFGRFADGLGIAYQLMDDLEDSAPNPASAVDALTRRESLDRETARQQIRELYGEYRTQCYEVMEEIRDTSLKIFAYRLTGKALKDV
ncbi:MAG: polyprenyl synthetase family protein [Planctomycetia bacterium]|nr:polyprenyl synthetase family protein [Planctomycetia bacterium]